MVSAQQNQLKINTGKDFSKSYLFSAIPFLLLNVNKELLPPRFYVNNLGFFCKQELKIQAAIHLPLKLRLGSVQYCDWMEGKKTTGILPSH
jgi:hypothetical protein